MLVAIERDTERRSNYSKIAVNPGILQTPMRKPFSTLVIQSWMNPMLAGSCQLYLYSQEICLHR